MRGRDSSVKSPAPPLFAPHFFAAGGGEIFCLTEGGSGAKVRATPGHGTADASPPAELLGETKTRTGPPASFLPATRRHRLGAKTATIRHNSTDNARTCATPV